MFTCRTGMASLRTALPLVTWRSHHAVAETLRALTLEAIYGLNETASRGGIRSQLVVVMRQRAGLVWARMEWRHACWKHAETSFLLLQGARHDPATSTHDSRDALAVVLRAHHRVLSRCHDWPGYLLS